MSRLSLWKAINPALKFLLPFLETAAEGSEKILVDVQIIDALLEQTQKHAERGEILDRYLERALPRSRAMLYEIRTTGGRLLSELKTAAVSS